MSEAKGDPRVTEVQEWLNETYGGTILVYETNS